MYHQIVRDKETGWNCDAYLMVNEVALLSVVAYPPDGMATEVMAATLLTGTRARQRANDILHGSGYSTRPSFKKEGH
jgi:hypothetical protein